LVHGGLEVFRFWLMLISIIFISACTRAGKDSSSSLVIKTPTRQQLASKSGLQAMAALPTDRKLCYGVSIKGVGIPGFAGNQCAPETGVVAGFIEEGGAIEALVPRGENRTIELYVYLMPQGSTNPCPAMGANLQGPTLSSTYLIGSKTGVNLLNDVETVEILVDFPGIANSVASQLNTPASCIPGSPPSNSQFHVSAAAGTAAAGTYKLRARIGRPHSGTTAIGGSYQLNGKVQ
jgi:hypothetical protein